MFMIVVRDGICVGNNKFPLIAQQQTYFIYFLRSPSVN